MKRVGAIAVVLTLCALAAAGSAAPPTPQASPTPQTPPDLRESPDCPAEPCAAAPAYRCEVLHRLRGIQRLLSTRTPDGFTYDPERATAAAEAALGGDRPSAGDDWWNPVAARVLHLLSRASALDPSADRREWLQSLDDLIALTQAFEILPQEQKDAVAGALPLLDRPDGRAEAVSLWSGIRRTFREHLEPPRTGALCSAAAARSTAELPARPVAAAPRRTGAGRVLAHQGGMSRWPPNSLAALRRAHDVGADGIECDLRLSGDGRVFVLHDPRLVDPSGGVLDVGRTASNVLERVFLLDPFSLHRASAEPPLMLRDLLRELGGEMLLWLELKPDGGDELAARVGDLLAARALPPGTVVVSSLAPAMVAPLRRRFPELLVAYESVESTPATVEALAASPDAHRLIASGLHFSTRCPVAFGRARELGLLTSSFTINRFDALEQALDAGVDFIQTDRPDRALWLRSRRSATR